MPKNKDFTRRIEILDECLRNQRKKWTLQLLIDTVNQKLEDRFGKPVSKRTIQDDMKYLIDEKEAPISKIKDGAQTYFSYEDPNFSLKNLPIKNEEIDRLNDAITILKQVNDFKILPEVEEIVNKLQNTVKTNVSGATSIIQFERHTTALGTEYIDDIFTAIKEQVCLRISYQSFKAEQPEQCIFHPYLLKEYRNRWFLIGRLGNSEKITNLALDRIKEIKNSIQHYILNDLFDPETYYSNMVGVSVSKESIVEEIEIKVNKGQAPYIRTKPIHYNQEIVKEYKDGGMKVRLNLVVNYELKSVLLSYGADIEVLKPTHLRAALADVFERAITEYVSK